MMEPWQYMVWLCGLLLASFGAGCGLGMNLRTSKVRKTNARRK